MRNNYDYTLHVEKIEDGYMVTVPSLPGCVTWGATIDEATQMGKEAILAYLESLAIDGLPIPVEQQETQTVTVSIAA